jgi:hypothetical protein
MSFIDIEGRSSRLRVRAQNLAITSESAPSSSKKWLSTGTCSTFITSASISASIPSALVAGSAVRVPARFPITTSRIQKAL